MFGSAFHFSERFVLLDCVWFRAAPAATAASSFKSCLGVLLDFSRAMTKKAIDAWKVGFAGSTAVAQSVAITMPINGCGKGMG